MPYQIIIALALPAFLALVGIEYYFSRLRKKPYYRFSSSVSNICIGIAERLSQLFLAGYMVVVLRFVQQHFSLWHIEAGAVSWLLLFILTDLMWYAYHRFSHTVNLLWGAHIVHHQSEEYNLTVSFRITVFQALIRFCFYLPLPVIGFPPEMILVTFSICGIYQFFIHTRFIKKLGVLEEILVTPSHHRVHHGSNALYLDKNFGGVLIVWDRIFGTFQRETEEVRYGLTKPVDSHSFLWLHFHFWLTLSENFKTRKGWRNKLKALAGGPESISYDCDRLLRKKYLSSGHIRRAVSSETAPVLYAYVYLQVALAVTVLFFVYLVPPGTPVLLSATVIVGLTLVNCGAILEQKQWIFPLEIARLATGYILAVLLSGVMDLLIYLPIFVLSVSWNYSMIRHRYLKLLYAGR